MQAIRRADVVLFLIDATRKVSQVDSKLSQELQRQFKPTVIVVNKWDEVDKQASPESYAEYLTDELRGLDYAPIVLASALKGGGLEDVITMAFNLHEQATHREGTGSINSVIKDVLIGAINTATNRSMLGCYRRCQRNRLICRVGCNDVHNWTEHLIFIFVGIVRVELDDFDRSRSRIGKHFMCNWFTVSLCCKV